MILLHESTDKEKVDWLSAYIYGTDIHILKGWWLVDISRACDRKHAVQLPDVFPFFRLLMGPPRFGEERWWLETKYVQYTHLGKRKIIFKMPFFGDMLVSWRVHQMYTYMNIEIIRTHSKIHEGQNSTWLQKHRVDKQHTKVHSDN